MRRGKRLFFLLITGVAFISCSGKKELPKTVENGGAYFSVREFAADQFRIFWGQPFAITRLHFEGGILQDSTMLSATNMDWASIVAPFFQSDISDPKFLDQYTFTSIDDDLTNSRTYMYEAKNDQLFTRMLQIATDPFTNKIKSVFIETKKGKLFYKPVSLIQIQSSSGGRKDERTEYRFLY